MASAPSICNPVTIYADGACEGNPGPGGWGAIVEDGETRLNLHGGFRLTTNNRMEIMAVLVSLGTLVGERRKVVVVSDSRYVVDAIAKGWLKRWVKESFVKRDGTRRENADLWAEMHRRLARHEVTTRWIRGHAGHAENEECDRMAVAARRKPSLPADNGYEAARGLSPAGKQLSFAV